MTFHGSRGDADPSSATRVTNGEPIECPPSPLRAGMTLGRYLLLEAIGAGGMGQVFRAYDPKLRREVALKSLRPDRLDPEAEARLVREAQAMAQLTHPNVVSVHDVDATDERIVIAMEYVPGSDLQDWLETRPHRWREVLSVFLRAGRGLAAAHEAGLVHRDFKPSNVLIGADGTPKVTDFGIAKAVDVERSVDEEMPDALRVTADPNAMVLTQADKVLGTPRYMAPEQHAGDVAGPAVDQFAFCVALWEALCGRPPYAGKELAISKQLGPPPWPKNVNVPRRIVQALERGLSPAAADRWPTMSALLAILDYDPSVRQRRMLAGTAVTTAVAFGSLSLHAWHSARARLCSGASEQLASVWGSEARATVAELIRSSNRSYAETTAEHVIRAIDDYAARWAQQHTDACEATAIRGEQSTAVLDARMMCLHRAKVALAASVEVLSEPDAAVVEKAQDVVAGLPALERCADRDLVSSSVPEPSPDELPAVEAVRGALAKARALQRAGRVLDASELIATVRLDVSSYRPLQAELAYEVGLIESSLSRIEPAKEALERAYTLALEDGDFDLAAGAASHLVLVHGTLDTQPEAAMAYATTALGLVARKDVSVEQRVLASSAIAAVLQERGQLEAAEHRFHEAVRVGQSELGPDHPDVMFARRGLANVLSTLGRYDEAEDELRSIIAARRRALGPDHPEVAHARSNLAVSLNERGHYLEAEREERTALALFERAYGSGAAVAQSHYNLAGILIGLGRFEEAETLARRAVELSRHHFGDDHPDVARAHVSWSAAVGGQGRREEALEHLRLALGIEEEVYGDEHPNTAATRFNFALALIELERFDEAEVHLRQALAAAEKTLSPDHAMPLYVRAQIGDLLRRRGRFEEAREVLAGALQGQETIDDAPERQGYTAFSLADALWELGRQAEAVDFARKAALAFTAAGEGFVVELGDVQRWLAKRRE